MQESAIFSQPLNNKQMHIHAYIACSIRTYGTCIRVVVCGVGSSIVEQLIFGDTVAGDAIVE